MVRRKTAAARTFGWVLGLALLAAAASIAADGREEKRALPGRGKPATAAPAHKSLRSGAPVQSKKKKARKSRPSAPDSAPPPSRVHASASAAA